VEADLQHAVPYLVRQLSVRKVVLTLTSKNVGIYLLMAGAKQLGDTTFIQVPPGATSGRGVLDVLYCVAPWCLQRGATSKAGEEEEPPGP
jgi:hypothetical protein